jgi:hypothetical protein
MAFVPGTTDNASLARLGLLDGATTGTGTEWAINNAQFLEVFSGEVMTAFESANVFAPLHRVRTIRNGKSAIFPYLGKMSARYHVPGEAIVGSNNPNIGRQVINIDDLLIADVVIYDLEDAKNYFEVRQEYSKGLGVALAKEYDTRLAQLGFLAARKTAPFQSGTTHLTQAPTVQIPDYKGGSVIEAGPTVETDALALRKAIFSAAQLFDEKDVPQSERYVVVKPAQYYALLGDTPLMNQEWHGRATYTEANLPPVAGMSIIKSNHLPTGVTAQASGDANIYSGDFTNSVALVMQYQALGTVKLFDLAVERSGADFHAMYQGDMFIAKYAMGHGILRPECAIEISKAAA